MLRSKLLAAILALATVGAALAAFAPSASAAEWHAYEGDLYPGNAYALVVPPGARSLEVVFDGPEDGSARVAIFDPAGARVGAYALDRAVPTAAILSPLEGRYVLFVHDVAGALGARVNSEDAPALKMERLALSREDFPVAEGDGGALDHAMTVTLATTPVFLTLLYEGSARDLDATVASATGDAVTIRDETGTAFSPGVWTNLAGTRTSDVTKLDGTTFTLKATAAAFEGRMLLSTLALAPAKVQPPVPPVVDPVVPTPTPALTTLAIEDGQALEFLATAGPLSILAPQDEEVEEESHDAEHAWFTIALYDPDDALVAFVDHHESEPLVLDLETDGRYVAFLHASSAGGALLQASALTDARELALSEEVLDVPLGGPSGFTLERAPVAMAIMLAEYSTGLANDVRVENEKGVVAWTASPIAAPFLNFYVGSAMEPANFAAGEHVVETNGLVVGDARIYALSYLRDAPIEAEPAEEADEAGASEGEAEAEEGSTEEEAEEEPAEEEPSGWSPFPWPW